MLIDDLGVERMAPYGADDPLTTPRLDALASESIRFHNAYASPLCSPSRAELLTGRWSHRYGLTHAVDQLTDEYPGLDTQEQILPEVLGQQNYTTALVGKWHLSTLQNPIDHPLQSGFDHHRGSLGNLDMPMIWADAWNYYRWEKVTDGVIARSTTYATTDNANEAVLLMETLPEPWFILVALQAAHGPWIPAPPAGLLSGTPPNLLSPIDDRFGAVVEAMDTEVGRIVEAVPSGTWVVATSDNGTPQEIIGDRGKATAWEPGVRVPLFIKGPDVAPRDEVGLVALVDLFPTILDLTETPHPAAPLDGVSLEPAIRSNAQMPRTWVYAGRSTPNYGFPDELIGWHRMIRNHRYKLIDYSIDLVTQHYGFYDLQTDPDEQTNLLEGPLSADQQSAYDSLWAEYQSILAL